MHATVGVVSWQSFLLRFKLWFVSLHVEDDDVSYLFADTLGMFVGV
jgi:hypothetical protein